MIFWDLLIFLGIAYVVQIFLTTMQMKDFNINFKNLRTIGRVAIGKKKGGFLAGSIIMFAVDNKGIILKGKYMSGISVLCRFKDLNDLNGINIANINEYHIKKYSKQLRQAILNSSSNYVTIMNGGKIEQTKSPFQKIVSIFKK